MGMLANSAASGVANAGSGIGKGLACPLSMVKNADVAENLSKNAKI